ncbi:alpha/beta hydrolase [Actinophytocola sp.]|uniref:alpha/beta fold hydrolase n=1 Tax=Actinophytocola sp. TaxID=1872138 RepID=UPI002D25A592|nr:alpha/beta hydrolase [Actinophytocola sp.]HYQ69866.1 alpha/beta hydrolase [Actinophytocola sp.]
MTTRRMSRFRRAALAIVLPVVVVGAVAACGDPAAPEATPSAGLHMIANDGHRLAFHVTPGHSPTLVLDAGGGEDSSYWNTLLPRLSRATGSRIITYDRAGMGASDEVKGRWDGRAAAADLHAGLRELGITRDVILVSHSQAGEVATYFARANPNVLSGAVLVDANLPQFFTDTQIQRIVALTAPQIEALEKQPSTKENRQLIATAENFGPTHQAYHQVSWPDRVPVTVIVSEKTPFDGSPQDAQHWRDAAAEFVAAGPGRTLVTAHASSHDVPKDNPALVLREVEQLAATG